jgi:hypothetical protein
MDVMSKQAGTELKAGWLAFAMAAAVGLLGANAFADAAGLTQSDPQHSSPGPMLGRVASGLVLFFLTYSLTRYLFRLGERLVSVLSTVRERPVLPITITLLVCGTLCVLGALGLSLYDGPTSASVSTPTVNMAGVPNMPQMGNAMRFSGTVSLVGPSISMLVRPLVTLLTLLLGIALLAVGVWGGLRPPEPALVPVIVPHVPEPPAG